MYPYFSIDNEDLPTQWAKMLNRYPQHTHKIRLTETGWPSHGEKRTHARTTHVHARICSACVRHSKRQLSKLPQTRAHPSIIPHTIHINPIPGSPNFANQTATFNQGDSYYQYYLKWACDQASQGSPATETFYYAYFDCRAPPKAPDYEQ